MQKGQKYMEVLNRLSYMKIGGILLNVTTFLQSEKMIVECNHFFTERKSDC